MTDMAEQPKDDQKHWLDDPKKVSRIFWSLVVVCAGLLAVDLFYHKHVILEAEGIFGFYGIFGFVTCVVLVLVAKLMRKVLMRDEDYYDR